MITQAQLHEFIGRTFDTADDVDFEEGFCVDWGIAFAKFLRRVFGLTCRPVTFQDGNELVHLAVWVDELRTAFDWRGADAHIRWANSGTRQIHRNFRGFAGGEPFGGLFLSEHHNALARFLGAHRGKSA